MAVFHKLCRTALHRTESVSVMGHALSVAASSTGSVCCTASGPVSTEAGDRIRVQFPMRDIYLGMWPATQVNSVWPSLRGSAQ